MYIYATDDDTGNGDLDYDDVVGADAKPERVYSFTYGSNNTKVYVVLDGTATSTPSGGETTTTYTYHQVDIMALSSDDTTDGTEEEAEVEAKIPEATAYDHINFGLWAGLGDAAKSGDQDLDSLGIGFVQSIGDGMTGDDLPNTGDATYMGNWVAAVQEADADGDGDISLEHGKAELTANFEKDTIKADLTNLAVLEGDITGSSFSGAKADSISEMHGLDDSGKFTGSFEGGFYGSKGAEAAGIFDFSSEDMEEGAFRGAFGGDKQ